MVDIPGRGTPGRDISGRDIPGRDIPPLEERRVLFDAQVDESNSSAAAWAAKLAVLGTGAHLFGRLSGVNFLSEAVNLMGRGAEFAGGLSRNKSAPTLSGMARERIATALEVSVDGGGAVLKRSWGGARLDEITGIRSIIDSLGVIFDPKNIGSSAAIEGRLKEYFGRMPRAKPGADNFFHHDLNRLTFGDILSESNAFIDNTVTKTWKSNQSLELRSIQEAIRRGWIQSDTVIDPKLFWSKTGATKGVGKKIIDTRMLDSRFSLDRLADISNMAGLTKSIASMFGSSRQVAMLGAKKGGRSEMFIGGNVFEISGKSKLKQIASNRRLGDVGDVLHLPASLREAAQQGQLGKLYDPAPVKDTFLGRAQEATGVGTRFQSKAGGPIQLGKQILQGARAVGKGDATFMGKEFAQRERGLFDALFSGDLVIPGAGVGTQTTKGSKFFLQGGQEISLKAGAPKTKWVKGANGYTPVLGKLGRAEAAAQRIGAYIGANANVALVNSSTIKNVNPDLFNPLKRGGVGSLERTLGVGSTPSGVTRLGKQDFAERAKYYASSGNPLDRAYDAANYLTTRLNNLASSSLLGIGFRPSPNLGANVLRLAAIPSIYMMGLEAVKYGDYTIGELTSFRPSHMIADAYTKLRVGQQQIRQGTGIANAANYIEKDLLPGFNTGMIGSFASAGLGLGILERTGSMGKALGVAGMLYAAVGGPSVGQSADSLRAEYAGDEKVAVRQARFWMMGYQPFSGGKIDHFAPSWYRQLKDNPQDKNVHGSEAEYWAHGTMLPTFQNWFHLKTALDPYSVERRNYNRRPYPITGGLGEEIPIIGPVVADTIGAIIKPRVRMHEGSSDAVAKGNITTRGVPEDVASRLGLPELPVARMELGRPDLMESRLRKYANVALEPTGIYKFAMQYMGVKIEDDYREADSGNLTSISRRYYNAGLGGAFGETEFMRRFLLSDYARPSKINEQINSIANTMPDWLPGSRSIFEKDRENFRDYSRGDAYSKLQGGEYRLPGAGYEAVNTLHSGESGIYDAVDRFLVLADVAPFSEAYYKYLRQVQQMKLGPDAVQRVDQATRNRDKKLDRFNFGEQRQSTLALANMHPFTKGIRNSYVSFRENVLSEVPILGSKFFPKRDPAGHYNKFQVEGDSFADWNKPYETIVRPAINDVANANPLAGAFKGIMFAALMSSGAGRFLNPVQALANPVSQRALLGAGAAAGAGVSTYRMVDTGQFSGGLIPGHIQEEREVDRYFDMLKHKKYSTLQELAASQGNAELANMFSKQVNKTHIAGLSELARTGDTRSYSSSLNAVERTYFEAFVKEPEEKREKILKMVPEHMRRALSLVYGKEVTKHLSSDHERVDEYFESNMLPSAGWGGWHPGVSDDAIQIRAIQGGINGISDSIHRFGFFPGQGREAAIRFPYLDEFPDNITIPSDNTDWMRDIFGKFNFSAENLGAGQSQNYMYSDIYDERTDDTFYFANDLRTL
jgi:hypothetical protein